MTNINLLPWREERREAQRKDFLAVLTTVVIAGLVLVGLVWWAMSMAVSNQSDRNAFIERETAVLAVRVKEIKQLKKRRGQLIDRMRVIQDLQGRRPVIVRVYDEIVRIMPDGVFFTQISSKGNRIYINGTAESNNRVASLMRNIAQSEWFSSPNLSEVKANRSYGEQANNFVMTFKLAPPKKTETAAAAKGKK
ncbi:MAG: PilN domain-containing protein [Pseudomonadales bacterium]